MMESRFTKEMIQCPVCLNEEPVTVWHAINALLDPDLKDKLLRKELQIQICSNCGAGFALGQPLLYLDPENKLVCYCHAGQIEDEIRAAIIELPGLPGWQQRLVEDYNQLIEKIHIADHHCDDRIIELVKLSVIRQQQEFPIKQLFLLTADDRIFRYIAADEDANWYTLDLESKIYLNAEQIASGHLPDISGDWQKIGTAYAQRLLKELSGL